jgi:hypothetical protein
VASLDLAEPVSRRVKLQRVADRDVPLIVFVIGFVSTCYVGALLLMFGPNVVRSSYVVSTGADIRPLTDGDVVVDLLLLNVAPVFLIIGWCLARRIRPQPRRPDWISVPSRGARRWAIGALVGCLLIEFVRLGMNGSLGQLSAWNDYAQLVAARERVLNGLWFGDFVLIYTVIPLLVAFLIAELMSGCWLRGTRASLAIAALLLCLLAINVAIFQKRSLIEALLMVTFVTAFRLVSGPRRTRVSLLRSAVSAASVVGAIYLVGLLLPLLRGTPYRGSGSQVSRAFEGAGFATGFEDGSIGWTTNTGNFLDGGGRYFIARGVNGMGLEVWGLPGQGIAYPTSLVAPAGSDWLLTAWLRSSIPQHTVLSVGVPGLDAARVDQATRGDWALHAVCWTPVQRAARAAIAFSVTRASRLYIDDVKLQAVQQGSCQDWKVVNGRLVELRPTRPSIPASPFQAPSSSIDRSPDLEPSAVVRFPDPTNTPAESATSIKAFSPVLGFLTRTAGPAVSYPTLYPKVFPYENIDLGLDLIGIGKAANDNITSWKGLFPLTPGGANAVPFMFALYAQGGMAVALIGSLLVGVLWWCLWLAAHLREEILGYRPAWLGLVVLFGVSLAGDSLRDALLASYGIVWPLAGLVVVAAGRRVLLMRPGSGAAIGSNRLDTETS